MLNAAIYARVSSEQQVQQATMGSQLDELRARVARDAVCVLESDVFVDDGYSGTTLARPALDRLRDRVASGQIDRIYVHAPDRLARKYAYQVLLVEEFEAHGIELHFLHGRQGTSPEDALLIQVQGVIAEYERTRLLERCRRGRLFKARSGWVNVLSCAPYGYRYVPRAGAEPARFEPVPAEVGIVQAIFSWVVVEQLALGAIARRLSVQGVPTRSGSASWSPSTVHGIIQNSAYIGEARFGKTESVAPQPRLRPRKGGRGPARVAHSSSRRRPDEEHIIIPVPAVLDRETFITAQAQLVRNREQAARRAAPERYLLQGLVVCAVCGTAYVGYHSPYTRKDGTRNDHRYYGCNRRKRRDVAALCAGRPVRGDDLEVDVWEAVVGVLHHPQRILEEWNRRNHADAGVRALQDARNAAARVVEQLEAADHRLLVAYEAEAIDVDELKARRALLRERLLRARSDLLATDQRLRETVDLREVITTVERFRASLNESITTATWTQKRTAIRALVRSIEIRQDGVRIRFRLPEVPSGREPTPDDSEERSCALHTRRVLPAGRGAKARLSRIEAEIQHRTRGSPPAFVPFVPLWLILFLLPDGHVKPPHHWD
jgi:site-specific DNA recombinase